MNDKQELLFKEANDYMSRKSRIDFLVVLLKAENVLWKFNVMIWEDIRFF